MRSDGRPHRLLVDLVAGRALTEPYDPARAVASAIEHGVDGLLNGRVRAGAIELDPQSRDLIARRALVRRRHLHELRTALASVLETFHAIGLPPPLLIKGLAAAEWYDSREERSVGDLDIVTAPDPDVAVLLARLDPAHPLAPVVDRVLERRWVQSIEIAAAGAAIDLHLDPFKLGVPARRPELASELAVAGGTALLRDHTARVLVPGPELALVVAAIHLNRDACSFLSGYADLVRIVRTAAIDWGRVEELSAAEGLGVLLDETFQAVAEDLAIELDVPRLGGRARLRRRLWQSLWGRRTRLRGDLGLERYARRERWLPLTLRGRELRGLFAAWRYYFPPRELVDYYFPEIEGGYLKKNLLGRFRHHRERQARQRAG